jgi:hypothetical protein
MTFASDMACMTVLLHYQVSDRRIRWWKYSFQLSGSAAIERVCLAEARSPALYFFATYKRAISATDTEFGRKDNLIPGRNSAFARNGEIKSRASTGEKALHHFVQFESNAQLVAW